MSKTILFDLGGVLVHLDWDQVCAPLAEFSVHSSDYVRAQVVNGPIVRSSMKGLIAPGEFHKTLCGKLGIDLPYETFVDIWNSLLRANEGIVSSVERAKSTHRLVLASNTDVLHFTYALEHFAVLGHFDRFFLSYEMGLLKPDPEFFHQLLRSLDAPPGDCVFIDDRAENVAAARDVGITALRFDGNEPLRADLAGII